MYGVYRNSITIENKTSIQVHKKRSINWAPIPNCDTTSTHIISHVML